MVHFSVFGGHEGQLSAGGCVYITLFGGSELKRPPLAARLAALRRPSGLRDEPRYVFLSLFGSTTIRWPTLAEEFLALTDALRAGAFTLDDWERFTASPGEHRLLRAGSFTLFGSMQTDALPTEEEELDGLSLQRHAGTIADAAVERLMLAVGQGGAQRLASVRQAVAASLPRPA